MDAADSTLPMAEPEQVGMSSERLARIRPLMKSYVEQGLVPGAVTMVARHGKVVHFDSCGYQDVEAQKPMREDSIFRIASMTKPIVSLALMMLYEEGRLQLHDPIAKYLPAFSRMQVMVEDEQGKVSMVPAQGPITVRHVLTHTAGFASDDNSHYKDIVRSWDRSGTIGDFVERLAQAPLLYEPGTYWHYSRATCVVGHLVEVISGKNLKDFLQERILDPLGMVDTHFFLPHEKLPRYCASYKPGESTQPGERNRIVLEDPASAESFYASEGSALYIGSGGLVSTASDYFRFADMLRGRGEYRGQRLVSRKTLDLMLQNHIGDRHVSLTGPGYGFGLGFGVMTDQGRSHRIVSPGSYTWGGMFCTYWWNDPVEQLFGMILTQVRPYDHLNIRMDMEVLASQAIID